nr:reverse transcriptase domain-containing protein [Tanacetum cinerariifolium]
MVDRTMEELLQAPTEGYGEAIVIPKILAENFEIKTNMLQLVQTKKFHGFERDNPHTHISNFKRMTSTLKYRDVPNDAIKLMLFPYSLEGAARICLLSNTMPNPKGEMKAVTTRSGLAYEGPSIHTNSPLEKVVERDTEETTDKEHSNCQGSIAHVQHPVVSISILEPDVPRTQSKPNIPYPSRLNDQKLHVCHALADLGASINLMPLSIWKKLSLPELTPTLMTLKLADRSITRPKGVAEDVFVKVRKFHFPTDFVVVDFEADPRVPLILGRSLLRTSRALIDVYGEEITLRVNDESVTFNLNQTMRYSLTYDDNSVNRVDVIDISYQIIHRCVHGQEAIDILEACHEGSTGAIIGIDFMGPFLSSKGNKYILIAVDYLSKWVEAKALPINDARVVVKFLKSLFSQFRTPRAIIRDRGTYFCNDQFTIVMTKYWVIHRLATAYHRQTSGQVEVSNRGLKRILERTIGENRASWSDKLDDALWAFRTTFKTPIGCTPYKLVYGKSCHLPIELEHKVYWDLKHVNFDLKTTGDHHKLQLNELNEPRDQAYKNSLIYKERTKKLHDYKIKNRIFNVSDQVLLFNSRLKIFSKKLKTRWSGPFTITQVFLYGNVELSQPDGPNFKLNGHRVKHYFGGDIPSKVVLDLHTIPMDK